MSLIGKKVRFRKKEVHTYIYGIILEKFRDLHTTKTSFYADKVEWFPIDFYLIKGEDGFEYTKRIDDFTVQIKYDELIKTKELPEDYKGKVRLKTNEIVKCEKHTNDEYMVIGSKYLCNIIPTEVFKELIDEILG